LDAFQKGAPRPRRYPPGVTDFVHIGLVVEVAERLDGRS
jgi:hypothetical protein